MDFYVLEIKEINMETIKYSNLSTEELKCERFGIPFFICEKAPRVIRRFEDSGYQRLSVNKELSKALLEFSSNERPMQVEELLKGLFVKCDACLVTDFEMLFDPRYEIDVVKFFCEQARKKNIAIRWPGDFTGTKLTYAEPGDPDYHEYYCDSYQMRIVV